nr:hypothetical protein [Salmonid herpesvirus 1]
MKRRLSGSFVYDVANVVHPRFGHMRRDVDLLSASDEHQRNEASDGCEVDKGSLVDEYEIWRLSPGGLQEEEQVKHKLPGMWSENIQDIVYCLENRCNFTLVQGVHLCPIHYTAHICSNKTNICQQLKLTAKVCGVDTIKTSVCVFETVTSDDPRFKLDGMRGCKIMAGIDQKFREALIYDGGSGGGLWVEKNNRSAEKVIQYHTSCKEVIMASMEVLVAFLHTLEQPGFIGIYEKISARAPTAKIPNGKILRQQLGAWWENNIVGGALSGSTMKALEDKVYQYAEVVHSIMYTKEMFFYVLHYKQIAKKEECNKEDVINCLLVPIICLHKLLRIDRRYSPHLIMNIFFKKSSNVSQSLYTRVDKTLSALYSEKAVRDLDVVGDGREMIDMLESMNAHSCKYAID